MKDDKSPQSANMDAKNKLLTLTDTKLEDEILIEHAKRELFKAGTTLGQACKGYKHTGSFAVHHYFSSIAGPTYITQMALGGASEYMTALSFNKLFHLMRRAYGYDDVKQKK